jgi:PhoD-like phosphatase
VVETDRPCTVGILGSKARTFEISNHHYGLVTVAGLASGERYEYTVELDGDTVWPDPGSSYPPSAIATLREGGPVRLIFGSCRLASPPSQPSGVAAQHEVGRGVDALTAFAEHLRHLPPDQRPDLILHLGDQVYCDELPLPMREYVHRRRRHVPGPYNEVVDFEEYTQLYKTSWSEPTLRWLLSTVSNSMIFDDHDVHDDWNTSLAWRQRMEQRPWWHERMVAAFMSYWIYQHAGNLDPQALADEGLLDRLQLHRGDAAPLLHEFAEQAHLHPEVRRWSYRRDLGHTRLLVIDSRAGRVLDPGQRDMLDAAEWSWLQKSLKGEVDHMLVASTLPIFLPRSLHDLEAWNERVSAGAWGSRAVGFAEAVRQALDLEHWAAFERSFAHLARLLRGVASDEQGRTPSTISCLGGDVHFGYVAEIDTPGLRAPIYQLVCSPMRNQLQGGKLRVLKLGLSPAGALIARALARLAGCRPLPASWRVTQGPWFENHVGELVLDGRRARLAIREAVSAYHPALRTRLLIRLDTGFDGDI